MLFLNLEDSVLDVTRDIGLGGLCIMMSMGLMLITGKLFLAVCSFGLLLIYMKLFDI